ncbi:MAG: M23 family metallopeptidase [Frankiales bacterium]|nr:M23 family metallopeptidase [Frankiales bacterium]
MDASSPEDVVVRAGLLRSVFRSRNDTLARLSTDRLALASTRAGMAAQERALTAARDEADRVAGRARTVAMQAETAVQRVAELVARRSAALRVAEANRAKDQNDYAAAQAASKALGERIREAARKAAAARAAAEAAERRQAAADAARKSAGQRPARPQRPSRSEPRDGQMLWPAPGPLTSRYGWRTHPIYGDRRFHAGIDIGGGYGAQVSAADTGIVTYAGAAGGYGTLVVISHRTVNGKDLSTAYAHMSQLNVSEGQSVGRGDKVGEIGNEGNSTGPHLHFEVRLDGEPVDPLDYVSPP